MDRYGWDAVWFLGSNGRKGKYARPLNFLRRDACLVGTWTGPDNDLLCVRRCRTAEDAEKYLSPAGWTITDAAIRAWWKLHREANAPVDLHAPDPKDCSKPKTMSTQHSASPDAQNRVKETD